jgi:hypothetical protein
MSFPDEADDEGGEEGEKPKVSWQSSFKVNLSSLS